MTSIINTEQKAHIIQNDQEAIAIAHELAAEFAKGDSERDQNRRLPAEEVQKFSQSGLWGITVPKEYGGAFVSSATLAEVVKIIAEADSSLGQIPQNHLYMVEAVRLDGTDEQKKFFFDLALQGKRFGNAFSEIGTKSVNDVQTKLEPDGSDFVLNGRKYYSAGALLAHWVPVIASNPDGKTVVAFVERDAPGLTLLDDWTSFGQRTTASGTTIIENVKVKAEHVIPHYLAFERATPMGAIAQIIQAAVDVGIAKAAVRDTIYEVDPMSVANPTQRRSIWKSQPFKGLLFIAVIAVISYIFELIFGQIIQLNVGTKLTYITICFVWWWHLGFSLNGYPGSRFSSTRFRRGTVNLVVLLALVYITGEAWKFISAKAILTDTPVGLWGQTAIITAAASLFFFDNTIVATEEVRNWHPVSGFINIFFAIFFIAPALTFLPQMWGLQPFYIPWYWYPCSTVFGSFFERWPLNKLELGMPRLGLLHTGIVLLLTLITELFLKQLGLDLFTTTTGPTFAAIWTTVGLGFVWQFNMWPFTELSQPTKGIVTSIASLIISVFLYLVTVSLVGQENIIQGLYWWFNILWVQVFLMAPGLYDGISLWQDVPPLVEEQQPLSLNSEGR